MGFWKMAQLVEVGDARRTRGSVVSRKIGAARWCSSRGWQQASYLAVRLKSLAVPMLTVLGVDVWSGQGYTSIAIGGGRCRSIDEMTLLSKFRTRAENHRGPHPHTATLPDTPTINRTPVIPDLMSLANFHAAPDLGLVKRRA